MKKLLTLVLEIWRTSQFAHNPTLELKKKTLFSQPYRFQLVHGLYATKARRAKCTGWACKCCFLRSWLGVHVYARGGSLTRPSQAINQCPGQPGQERFQTHLQKIMPAIPRSPRDRRANLMNHCPLRGAVEWISPCCVSDSLDTT